MQYCTNNRIVLIAGANDIYNGQISSIFKKNMPMSQSLGPSQIIMGSNPFSWDPHLCFK